MEAKISFVNILDKNHGEIVFLDRIMLLLALIFLILNHYSTGKFNSRSGTYKLQLL